jgi:hypothetical protein
MSEQNTMQLEEFDDIVNVNPFSSEKYNVSQQTLDSIIMKTFDKDYKKELDHSNMNILFTKFSERNLKKRRNTLKLKTKSAFVKLRGAVQYYLKARSRLNAIVNKENEKHAEILAKKDELKALIEQNKIAQLKQIEDDANRSIEILSNPLYEGKDVNRKLKSEKIKLAKLQRDEEYWKQW